MASAQQASGRISNGVKVQLLQLLLCALIIALVLVSYLFAEKQRQVLAAETMLVERLSRVAQLSVDIKNAQVHVIQVQQFLTDISATRGLDGLDDGFEVAAEHASEFLKVAGTVSKSASELHLPEIASAITEATANFAPFYENGKKMAAAYVAEGPASGNKMMGDFDASATAIGDAVSALLASADKATAQATAEAMQLQDESSAFESRLLLLGLFAIAAGAGAVAYAHMLDRQSQAQQRMALSLQEERAKEQQRNAEASAAIIRHLGEGLRHLSEGDLTFSLGNVFPPSLQVLRDHFNSAVQTLSKTMITVKEGSSRIRHGTLDIAQASDDLSRRTESQAAGLEETAAAVAEITGNIHKNAEASNKITQMAAEASVDATASSTIVQQAVDTMKDIEASSAKINQITSVVDEIAFQTNLLALNAGVEAARAGEAGRGFAVVAAEVRALSARSSEASREIRALLDSSHVEIRKGAGLIADAGNALARISQRVSEISGVISEVSSAAQHQAISLKEVNIAVEQIDKATQQNAAMAEQATAATQMLSSQTEELAGIVATFRTPLAA